jgi:hypothetical protein
VRKVEGEIEVKTMEDGRRRKERGVGERDGFFLDYNTKGDYLF